MGYFQGLYEGQTYITSDRRLVNNYKEDFSLIHHNFDQV